MRHPIGRSEPGQVITGDHTLADHPNRFVRVALTSWPQTAGLSSTPDNRIDALARRLPVTVLCVGLLAKRSGRKNADYLVRVRFGHPDEDIIYADSGKSVASGVRSDLIATDLALYLYDPKPRGTPA